ncbi:hypothetical protein SDC9_131377 [bioreactor metagenome]|uniref:Uncharacterized protein n=1 Tax=bioreactor metagenome TaxID=1076179 RepID=A0A645D4K5_9ZZZZ
MGEDLQTGHLDGPAGSLGANDGVGGFQKLSQLRRLKKIAVQLQPQPLGKHRQKPVGGGVDVHKTVQMIDGALKIVVEGGKNRKIPMKKGSVLPIDLGKGIEKIIARGIDAEVPQGSGARPHQLQKDPQIAPLLAVKQHIGAVGEPGGPHGVKQPLLVRQGLLGV